ncbi:MAG: 23S rRNA (uracil1939-C5)-methyltransferase [Candidatus Marinamargulisbacteria bacterium]|jgi:23S rRNA (uracil1939-C5)-methyltransferase
MLKKNEKVNVEVSEWAEKGLALGVLDNQSVVLPFSAPGDSGWVHITKPGRSRAFAKWETLEKSASCRVKAPCDVFGKCGGCQLQHVDAGTQSTYKENRVTTAFQVAGLPEPDIFVHPVTMPVGYRNKVQFSFAKSREGQVLVGLTAPRSQRVIDAQNCEIAHPLINKIVAQVRQFMFENEIPIFDEGYPGMAHLVVRVGIHTNEAMVGLVSNLGELPEQEKMVALLRSVPEVKSIYHVKNPDPTWQILAGEDVLLWGSPTIKETLGGIDLEISLRSFFQANPSASEVLWARVIALMNPQSSDTILDLYCGTGTIGLFLAKGAGQVIGIESSKEAVKNAEQNAKANSITNCRFVAGDVDQEMEKITEACKGVVLNPPRQGASSAVLAAIIKEKIETVVYVSCAPDSLSRDLKILSEAGYKIESVECVDLFPQTYHVETVVLLKI